MRRRPPPLSEDELRARAETLAGHTLGELAYALETDLDPDPRKTKGKIGALFEAALGASGGSGKTRDFPGLDVELKTLPLRSDGTPTESTYVCTLHVQSAESLAWETSWVRQKLSNVLFVPLEGGKGLWSDRRIGRAFLWRPSAQEEATLRQDFEDLVGMVTTGHVESLSAHHGAVLQVRPKARNGKKTALVHGPNGEIAYTVPKGFYLRTSFTAYLVRTYSI